MSTLLQVPGFYIALQKGYFFRVNKQKIYFLYMHNTLSACACSQAFALLQTRFYIVTIARLLWCFGSGIFSY